MHAHKNNIGFLRLVFASLVIFGHAPEVIDGDRHREPIHMLFGTMSLGELSVDAFFLLSGYLITRSMAEGRSWRVYLLHRVLRIYPAYMVAYVLSVLLAVASGGLAIFHFAAPALIRMLTLQIPLSYPGELPGISHYNNTNGSMWTISYEFGCYLLVLGLGVSGWLRRRAWVAALTIALGIAAVLCTFHAVGWRLDMLGAELSRHGFPFGPAQIIRLSSVFLIGSCFYLYREMIGPRLTGFRAAIATALVVVFLYHDPHFAELALTTIGAIPLFWLAYKARLGALQRINDRWDISYGVYLYGWPVMMALLWLRPNLTPLALGLTSWTGALCFGAASWLALEAPMKTIARKTSWRSEATRPPSPETA